MKTKIYSLVFVLFIISCSKKETNTIQKGQIDKPNSSRAIGDVVCITPSGIIIPCDDWCISTYTVDVNGTNVTATPNYTCADGPFENVWDSVMRPKLKYHGEYCTVN